MKKLTMPTLRQQFESENPEDVAKALELAQ